jgi:hypothetical protein
MEGDRRAGKRSPRRDSWARKRPPLTSAAGPRRIPPAPARGPIDPAMLLILDFLARRFDIGWMQAAGARVRYPELRHPMWCWRGGMRWRARPRGCRSAARRSEHSRHRGRHRQSRRRGRKQSGWFHLRAHCTAARFRWPKTTRSKSRHWLDPAGDDYDPLACGAGPAVGPRTGLSRRQPGTGRSRPRLGDRATGPHSPTASRAISRSKPWRCWATSARGIASNADGSTRSSRPSTKTAVVGGPAGTSRPTTTRPSSPCGCCSSKTRRLAPRTVDHAEPDGVIARPPRLDERRSPASAPMGGGAIATRRHFAPIRGRISLCLGIAA